MNAPRVTILMSVKGRHLHTLRFLWHANRVGLRYPIVIADGQVTPVMARLLENPEAAFPKLDIDYVRYPDDVSYGDWYRKVASAAGRVKTPYVMQAENDDFVVASGVEFCANALDAQPDYASYGGGFGAFSLRPGLYPMASVNGDWQSLNPDCYGTHIDHDYASPLASERIRQLFTKSHTLYYNVFRTPALAAIWQDCAALGFSDLQVFETYFGARAKSLGKSRIDRSIMSYMWQAGTSTSQAPIQQLWTDRIAEGWSASALGPAFEADIEAFAASISSAVAAADGIDAEGFAAEIRQLYRTKFQQQLEARIALRAMGRAIDWRGYCRSIVAGLTPDLLIRWRRRRLQQRAREVLFQELRLFGAPERYISIFGDELGEIERSLAGQGFAAFVRDHAPELIEAP